MVINVALVVGNHPAAGRGAFNWRLVVHAPRQLVDGVNALLDEAVARQPGEVHPVAELPFQVADARLAGGGGGHGFHRAGQVGAVDRTDIAHRSGVDLLVDRAAGQVTAPTEAADEVELLFLGHPHRFHHVPDAGGIGGDGFFAEDVFALFDRVPEVGGAESRRRGEEDHIDHVDHLFIGIQAGEGGVVGDGHPVAELFLQATDSCLDGLGKGVADRGQDAVRIGGHGVAGGAGSAATTADQADLQRVGVGGEGRFAQKDSRGRDGEGGGRG